MRYFTIGQISKRINLPTKTIRFYEEIGLVKRPERDENGYRKYSPKDLNRLRLIKQVKDLGLPIVQMKKLMQGCTERECHHTKHQVIGQLSLYTAYLEGKIEQMDELKFRLKDLQRQIKRNEDTCDADGYCCDFLAQLAGDRKEREEKGGERQCTEHVTVQGVVAVKNADVNE